MGMRSTLFVGLSSLFNDSSCTATPDGASFWNPPEDQTNDRSTAYSPEELAAAFDTSERKDRIMNRMNEPWEIKWESPQKKGTSFTGKMSMAMVKTKYKNSAGRMMWLNFKRFILIWLRDRRVLIANAIKNIIMGCSVGGVFFQTDSVASIYGVFFQTMLFIMLGK